MAACLSLAVFAAAFWWSGAVTPRVRWEGPDHFLASYRVDENGTLTTRLLLEVENEGVTPFVLTGLSVDIPGLRLLPVSQADETEEVAVGPGDTEFVRRSIAITDCTAVPHEPQPVRFGYRTWMGSGTAEVVWDSWYGSVSSERVPLAWQQGLATKVCNEAVTGEWL